MLKKYKALELSSKALGAAMFMFTVCLFMAICALYNAFNEKSVNMTIPFALLIHGIILSLMCSGVWVLFFGLGEKCGFVSRYLPALVLTGILFGISMIIPVIKNANGVFFWIISGFVSSFLFGSGIAVLSEIKRRKTGIRSVLLWELQ